VSLQDDLAEAANPDESDILRGKLDNAEHEAARLRATIAQQTQQIDALERIAGSASRPVSPPHWLKPRKREAAHRVTLAVVLSDMHFDEVVDPSEMDGYNAYDRDIAEMRLKRFTERVVTISRTYMAGVKFDGLVLVYGGDAVSGNIHPELRETNQAEIFDTIDHWSDQLAACVGTFADEFGNVYAPCTVGNHGRNTVKERFKRRVRDNADWLIARNLDRYFAKDDRVRFHIPDSFDVPFEIYDTGFVLNHGQVRGGYGIGGVWPPVMRLRANMSRRYGDRILVIGHHHQYIPATEQGLLVNGALKGYDEYAAGNHFVPERATQAMFAVSPEHGVTNHYPIFVADRAREGW